MENGGGDESVLNNLLEEIARNYAPVLHRTAREILKDHYLAEDVVQEVYIRFHIKYRARKIPQDFHTWPDRSQQAYLRRMVQHASVNTLLRRREIVVDPADPEGSIARYIVKCEKEQADEFLDPGSGEGWCNQVMGRALEELPEAYREPLILTHIHDCSGREIAGKLGISEGAVHKRLQRGREMLRRRMEGVDYKGKGNN